MSLFAFVCRAHYSPRGPVRVSLWSLYPSKQRNIGAGASKPNGLRQISSRAIPQRDAAVDDVRNIGIVAHVDAVSHHPSFD